MVQNPLDKQWPGDGAVLGEPWLMSVDMSCSGLLIRLGSLELDIHLHVSADNSPSVEFMVPHLESPII